MEKVISKVCYRTELESWLELAQRPDLAIILDGKVKTKIGYGKELGWRPELARKPELAWKPQF